MEKITDIIQSIANEKNLNLDDVKDKVTQALINTAKRIYGQQYEFFVDPKSLKLYQKILVLDDDDERLKEENEQFLSLSKARKEAADIEVGDELTYECSLENLGRTAVNTLHKELEYHVQKLLEETIYKKYKDMLGAMVFGTVVRVDSEDNTYIEIDELRAFLPRKNRIKGEFFKVGDVIKAVIRKVYMDKNGIRIELSRTSPKFLEALLEAEVPEIKDGLVSIIASARIPGERAKVALISNSANVDCVGATVGSKGVRINAISKELNGENIDCIEYSNEAAIFITRALAPAIVNSVSIEDKKAIVGISSEQKSKAIGKNGINIRLASMISSYEIELKELQDNKKQDNEEAMKNLENLFKNI
ncbi:transcription termination factor [Campylobacter avium LMG 24591]|uniref:Transcription termination/antitermination protein NusA n=1 Tax=Campylobacter avium LMG 24591 TaxID=522484 RepID=A0A222MWW9_9BACT|nr:transcription termination factor NusA [Campylobacter avium]ASQ30584.1 transcription termination factor [Campylobacter avium LMG 24591]OYD79680.1 transcription termination factor [Campylobacter avium]HJE66621.1 transcription termination factor NusA [Campylobacter avium]